MKKIILVVLSALLTIGMASAQQRGGRQGGERPSPEAQAERQIAQMKEKLDLSDDQVVEIKELFTQASENREEGTDPRAQREEMNAKITEVLTDDQQEAWSAMLKEQEEMMKSRKRPQGRE